MTDLFSFYKGRRVLVTGHTGFKGSWLVFLLAKMGAKVCGYALAPETKPALYDILGGDRLCEGHVADVRDLAAMQRVFDGFRPEIVFHLAAQPLVLAGYARPVYTFETNVMGSVHMLECVRRTKSVKSVVNVTTDKVYKNTERQEGYREEDVLCGYDPYSNSKSCSELVTYSYTRSYLQAAGVAVSTARAGNVIGGGDFSDNRIIPDCVKAAAKGEAVVIRNPRSVRPYQHVLEPLAAYLTIAAAQYGDGALAGSYNIGPDRDDCVYTEKLVSLFCGAWKEGVRYTVHSESGAPHEAGLLMLDNAKVKETFGISPVWGIAEAVKKTVEWSKAYYAKEDMRRVTEGQIEAFFADRLCGKNSKN